MKTSMWLEDNQVCGGRAGAARTCGSGGKTTGCTPHASTRRRATAAEGASAITGTPGRSRLTRTAAAPSPAGGTSTTMARAPMATASWADAAAGASKARSGRDGPTTCPAHGPRHARGRVYCHARHARGSTRHARGIGPHTLGTALRGSVSRTPYRDPATGPGSQECMSQGSRTPLVTYSAATRLQGPGRRALVTCPMHTCSKSTQRDMPLAELRHATQLLRHATPSCDTPHATLPGDSDSVAT